MKKALVGFAELTKLARCSTATANSIINVQPYRRYATPQRSCPVEDPYAKFIELASKTQPKTVLITGALGQLGRSLAAALRFVFVAGLFS
ncbi:unnamed protein product [Gongylonema pulchrum]|uniref:RmlD_sub_bind domain-containing protein n=1 Tax=Gongylonema pulchrum TaxID=637853 RepID=A0A183DIG8_9BILA|nr:unnamed protein product [Gongylonema pulchrum]